MVDVHIDAYELVVAILGRTVVASYCQRHSSLEQLCAHAQAGFTSVLQ
jgi:hypothetical protein